MADFWEHHMDGIKDQLGNSFSTCVITPSCNIRLTYLASETAIDIHPQFRTTRGSPLMPYPNQTYPKCNKPSTTPDFRA